MTNGIGPLVGAFFCGWLRQVCVDGNGNGWQDFWWTLAAMIAACTAIFALLYRGEKGRGIDRRTPPRDCGSPLPPCTGAACRDIPHRPAGRAPPAAAGLRSPARPTAPSRNRPGSMVHRSPHLAPRGGEKARRIPRKASRCAIRG